MTESGWSGCTEYSGQMVAARQGGFHPEFPGYPDSDIPFFPPFLLFLVKKLTTSAHISCTARRPARN